MENDYLAEEFRANKITNDEFKTNIINKAEDISDKKKKQRANYSYYYTVI